MCTEDKSSNGAFHQGSSDADTRDDEGSGFPAIGTVSSSARTSRTRREPLDRSAIAGPISAFFATALAQTNSLRRAARKPRIKERLFEGRFFIEEEEEDEEDEEEEEDVAGLFLEDELEERRS